MFLKNLALLIPILCLVACGGSSDSSSDSSSSSSSSGSSSSSSSSGAAASTGVFVDSPVAGISYRTATQQGETTAGGEYQYVEGETVVFFIGGVELPPVAATGVVTPLDIFTTTDFTDRRVINLARLLQSLDEDTELPGIQIAAAAHTQATDLTIDFNVAVEEFEANTDVLNLVSNGGGNGTLISAEDALAHLQQVSIVGSWFFYEELDLITLTFMHDGTYMMAHEGVTDDAGQSGIEYGTYNWNAATQEFSVDVSVDTNGEWGLSTIHEVENLRVLREGDVFVMLFTEDAEDVRLELARASDASNPLVGGWVLSNEGAGAPVLVLLANGDFTLAQATPADGAGTPGNEIGEYTWNAETGALSVAKRVDTNGDWGFDNTSKSASVEGHVLTVVEGEDTVQLDRVDGPAPALRLGLVVTETLVEYSQGERFEVDGAIMQCDLNETNTVGDTETYAETWFLNLDPTKRSYVYNAEDNEEFDFNYDPATGVITASGSDPKSEVTDCVGCTVTYYEESTWSFEGLYDPAAESIISGEYEETMILSWNIDDSESVCYERIEVTAEPSPAS